MFGLVLVASNARRVLPEAEEGVAIDESVRQKIREHSVPQPPNQNKR
jgi:hypothetical protein